MSLSDRGRAFLDASRVQDAWGLILSSCDIRRASVGRRKWARRAHRGTITLSNGTRIYISVPRAK